MPTLAHRYSDFGLADCALTKQSTTVADTFEDAELAAFDSGYQAGWEDAVKAQASNAERAAIDVAQNLQDMSFVHHEAYLKLSMAMKPLFTQIVDKLLPRLAQRLVGVHIVEQLNELLDSHAEAALEIAVAPENLEDIQSLLADVSHIPFSIVAELSLSSGQAYLRASAAEVEINIDAVLSGVSEAIDAFYDQTKEETKNG